MLGSKAYMALEIHDKQARVIPKGYDAFATDMFAMGCLLYEMIAGTPPFDGKNFNDVTKAKKDHDITKMNFFKKSRTPCCIDLIERLLDLNPNDRINIEQVLNHPFVKMEPADFPKYMNSDKILGNEIRKQEK